jgi:hypothetical protein
LESTTVLKTTIFTLVQNLTLCLLHGQKDCVFFSAGI